MAVPVSTPSLASYCSYSYNPFVLVLKSMVIELISDLGGKHIALDSKRLKGSKNKGGYTHILSAWVDEFGLGIAQETVREKCNLQ